MKNETETQQAQKDPVCGMNVEADTAAGKSTHKGQTYYFCGMMCKQKFDKNPDQYLTGSSASPASGKGCCG